MAAKQAEKIRKAFDIQLYLYLGLTYEQARQRMVADVTSIFAAEASAEDTYKRVIEYSWAVRDIDGRQRVVCPEFDPQSDVRESGKGEEQTAFNFLVNELLTREDRFTAIWLSAPKAGVYPEGRIVVFTSQDNGRGLDCLGICLGQRDEQEKQRINRLDWNEEKFMEVGDRLSKQVDDRIRFADTDQLRGQALIFTMPDGDDRGGFLQERLPELSQVWNWAVSGGMEQRQSEIEARATQVVDEILPELWQEARQASRVPLSPPKAVSYGGRIEREMIKYYPVRLDTGCGLLNLAIGERFIEPGMVFGSGLDRFGSLPTQSRSLGAWMLGRVETPYNYEGTPVKQCPYCQTTEWWVGDRWIKERKFKPDEKCGGTGPQHDQPPCQKRYPKIC